jgi:hypothetical protein
MSWSASFKKPTSKDLAELMVDNLNVDFFGEGSNTPAFDQVKLAKAAAKELLKGLPGPWIMVSISGHANGVGWQEKAGYANDCITVNVSQVTVEPT